MAKKEYMLRIYLRAEECIITHFKYIYLVDSKNGGLAWVAANSITHLRMHNREPKYFASIEEAEKCKRIMDFHNCEVVSKWVPKPVSSAQRSLSRQYCQKKRQFSGVISMLKPFCTTPASQEWLSKIEQLESKYLTFDYKVALKKLKEKEQEKKND